MADTISRRDILSGAAGLAVGFIVLGILPFIEKAFRITTSMTLLELADVSHPLQRRLQAEAAGTYTHSLTVATIAWAGLAILRTGKKLSGTTRITRPRTAPTNHPGMVPNVAGTGPRA